MIAIIQQPRDCFWRRTPNKRSEFFVFFRNAKFMQQMLG